MTAQLIDGRRLADQLRAQIKHAMDAMRGERGVTPGLAAIVVGDDPAGHLYLRAKIRLVRLAGMNSIVHQLPGTATTREVVALVARLNADESVNGISFQLPLPPTVDGNAIFQAIAVEKDVDGLHPSNMGLLAVGQPRFVPCTPQGCLRLLRTVHADLAGARAVVLGRSNAVGKPMAQTLLAHHCTVTLAHSGSRDLPELVGEADIVIAAIGKAGTVRGHWLRRGCTVVDVGINRLEPPQGRGIPRYVGDVAYDEAVDVAGAVTPVPGGVGPMTMACLLLNTFRATAQLNTWRLPEALA